MKNISIKWLALAVAATCAGGAQAFTFESEGGAVRGSFDSTITFGLGVRDKSPGCDTVIGTAFGGAADPLGLGGAATPPSGNGAPAGCLDMMSGYNDQGNLNYKKGQVFTEYLKGTHELLLKLPDDYKFMARVNWVKDFAAPHASGYISGVGASAFPGDAKRELDHKVRLLDLWVSKEFDLNGERARIRVGNQVVSWGESLFLPGGVNQTNAMDIQRLSQPGTQLKEVFLPAPIASLATGLGDGFNVEGYVQGSWNKNYFPPVGSYWSTATIGSGATEAGIPTTATPRNGGQWGLALRYQPTGTQANLGVYAMNYHDKAPVLSLNPATPSGFSYSYLSDRTMYGASLNFPVGNWAIGSELSYRPKDAVSLGGACMADGKCYVEEEKYQFHLTGLLSLTPGDHGAILDFLHADTATLLAEAAMVRYPGLKRSYNGGAAPVAAGYWGWGFLTASDTGFTTNLGNGTATGDKTSWGYNFDFSWTYDGTLIPGWQVTPEVYYFEAVKGRTPNAMALFMEGAKSANFIVTFTQNPANWVVGVNYAKFWGGGSVLDQPLRNRDFYGAYVSRNF